MASRSTSRISELSQDFGDRCERRVELAYLSPEHDQVRISGQAEVLADRALLQEIWDANPLLRHYLGSLDNPELIVYRIVPEQVRFMREWSLEYHDVPIEAPARNAP